MTPDLHVPDPHHLGAESAVLEGLAEGDPHRECGRPVVLAGDVREACGERGRLGVRAGDGDAPVRRQRALVPVRAGHPRFAGLAGDHPQGHVIVARGRDGDLPDLPVSRDAGRAGVGAVIDDRDPSVSAARVRELIAMARRFGVADAVRASE